MNDKTDPLNEDEFDSFDGFEDMNDLPSEEGEMGMAEEGEPIDDADFQDIPDDLDADVFADAEDTPPSEKKKTNWFNIGVAAVAVLVAGGLVLSKLGPQLMGGGADAPAPVMSAAPVMNGNDPAQSMAAAQQAVQAQGNNGGAATGLLENPDQFSSLASQPATREVPEETSGIDDPFAALSNVQKAPAASTTTADAGSVPMPAPISQEPVSQEIPDAPFDAGPMDITAEPTLDAEPDIITARAPAQSAPPAQNVALSEPFTETADTAAPADSALASKVNTLEDRLETLDDKITTALERLENANAVQVAATPVNDTRLDAIQSALERLESRIDKISSAKPQAVSSPAPVREASKPAAKKTTSAPKKSTKSTSSSGWDAPYNPSKAQKVSTKSASASSSGGWELRGAQPGRAIIAAKSGDIREVGVGDTVPGLGEVTGVANVNGRWIVQGTQGRLSQ